MWRGMGDDDNRGAGPRPGYKIRFGAKDTIYGRLRFSGEGQNLCLAERGGVEDNFINRTLFRFYI